MLRTLDDRWPVLDIVFGCFFFVAAQVLFYGFSNTICDQASHCKFQAPFSLSLEEYSKLIDSSTESTSTDIDGTFFHTLCTLFGTMMVYSTSNFSPFSPFRTHSQPPPEFLIEYWCSITKEDLEFSVGSKMGAWEVKGLLNDEPDEVLSHQVGMGGNVHPSRGTLNGMGGQAYPPQKSGYGGYGY